MPYGYFNHTWLLPTLKKEGYALVHWSCDEEGHPDADRRTRWPRRYIAHAKPGAVFLFHDGGRHREKTLQAVTLVVDALEKRATGSFPAEEMFK